MAQTGFLQYYMETVAEAFGEELDNIRKEDGLGVQGISSLIDAIQGGVDVISQAERKLTIEGIRGDGLGAGKKAGGKGVAGGAKKTPAKGKSTPGKTPASGKGKKEA